MSLVKLLRGLREYRRCVGLFSVDGSFIEGNLTRVTNRSLFPDTSFRLSRINIARGCSGAEVARTDGKARKIVQQFHVIASLRCVTCPITAKQTLSARSFEACKSKSIQRRIPIPKANRCPDILSRTNHSF